MEDKRSCCCGAFSQGLWWLLTLLGLPLLYFFMFNANKDPIETDLTQRVTDTLVGEKMAWAKVDVDERGRDIILSGEAPSAEAKNRALALAKSVTGVRVAESHFTDVMATEAMTLDVNLADGKIQLNGTVSSQDEIDAIVKAATERVGEGNVVNNLTISNKVKAAGWLAGISGLMGLALDGGSLSASAEGLRYTGIVDNKDKQDALMAKANDLLGSSDLSLIDRITVEEPAPTEAMTFNALISDGKIVLDGSVSSQAEVDAIVKAATERVGEGNVTNNLTVAKTVKPSSWLDHISGLFALTPDGGSLSASGDGVKYTGLMDSDDSKNSLLDKAKAFLASFNIPVINGLTVKEPEPEPEPVVVKEPEPEPTPEPEPAPEPEVVKEEVKEAINVCQNKLNDTMSGKSIHFRTNAAVIQLKSHALLDAIAGVMAECQDEIEGGISINGHTDSRGDDAYNMALSLRRAGAVRSYLQREKVNPSLMKSVGHGETNPIASNDTREGQAQNRRITFIINSK
ncbi:MAG: OmpA family protein [Thiotrichaceae bacterium]